jgi:Flp pilus assembly pilin Flp
MKSLKTKLRDLLADDAGAEIMEYVLVAGIVIVSAITLVVLFGGKVVGRWNSVNSLM